MVLSFLLKILKDLFVKENKPIEYAHVLPWKAGPITIEVIARDPITKFDRRLEYPWRPLDYTNATKLSSAVNKLYHLLPMNLKSSFSVTSAYRPGKYNERAGGAPNSLHTTCEALDLSNVGNVLGTYLCENEELLSQCGLYMENPDATLTTKHVHLQIRAPKSGKRIFWP